MKCWNAVELCIRIGLLFALCEAQSPQFNQATDLAVGSSGQVYVSGTVYGRYVVYRLNSRLAQQESVTLSSGVSVVRLALSPEESRLVVCVSNKSCISYDANNLSNGPVNVFQSVLSDSSNVALVTAPVIGGGNSFYVGSSNGTVILIGQYGLDGAAGSVSRSSGNLFGVTAGSFTRNWFGGFVAGSYTYFVVFDVRTSSMRVLRVCDNSNETSVAAMYEAEVNCYSSSAGDESSKVVGVSLLESFPSGGATLVIGLVTPTVNPYNRVCTVRLSSVDNAMNTASCSGTSLPWRATVSSAMSCPNRCNIPSPGAVEGSVITLEIADVPVISANTFTSILAFNYESLALLFIASGSSLQTVSIGLR